MTQAIGQRTTTRASGESSGTLYAGGGGGGMDQGRRFGKARIRFGSESKEKVIPAILAVVVLAAVVQLVAQEIWMVSQEVLIPVVVEVAEEATLTLLQILADNGAVLEARAVPVSY